MQYNIYNLIRKKNHFLLPREVFGILHCYQSAISQHISSQNQFKCIFWSLICQTLEYTNIRRKKYSFPTIICGKLFFLTRSNSAIQKIVSMNFTNFSKYSQAAKHTNRHYNNNNKGTIGTEKSKAQSHALITA